MIPVSCIMFIVCVLLLSVFPQTSTQWLIYVVLVINSIKRHGTSVAQFFVRCKENWNIPLSSLMSVYSSVSLSKFRMFKNLSHLSSHCTWTQLWPQQLSPWMESGEGGSHKEMTAWRQTWRCEGRAVSLPEPSAHRESVWLQTMDALHQNHEGNSLQIIDSTLLQIDIANTG